MTRRITRIHTGTRIAPITLALAAGLGSLALTGCEKQSSAPDDSKTAGSSKPSWVLTATPRDPKGILETKQTAAEGDRVVIRGIIGGSLEPLSENSPVFRVVDTELFNLCAQGDDHCNTPWDYCCADPDEVKQSSATVVLVGEDGKMIEGSPVDAGLKGMHEVIVVGRVAPRENEQVLTIRATGVHRVGG